MIKLTIIIPHYNSPVLLERLLKTIPQTKEIQVIVIDDNSDEIYKEKYLEIKKEHNINIEYLCNYSNKKGAGSCRNIGLERVLGEWVLCADADDYFTEDFFEVIQKYLQASEDVIFFKPTSVELDTGKLSNRHVRYEKLVEEYLRTPNEKTEMFLRYKYYPPWSKLIKASLIKENNIYFDEVIASNDVMFSTKIGYNLNNFIASDEIIYCVTRSKGSLTMVISSDVFDSRLNVFINYNIYLKKRLTNREFNYLGLSGRNYLVKSLDLGFRKTVVVYRKLFKNRIRVIEFKILNPIWLLTRIKKVHSERTIEKKYYKKDI